MIERFGRILLGLVLLAQAGPLCACALEHALLCGGANDPVAALTNGLAGASRCCGDPGCTAPTSCPRHPHHETTCSARGPSAPANQQASNTGPLIADFAPLSFSRPLGSSQDRGSIGDPPDLPVGTARSLPLLI